MQAPAARALLLTVALVSVSAGLLQMLDGCLPIYIDV